MTNDGESRRQGVETALGNLARSSVVLESRTLVRVRQAMQRDASLRGLLEPAVDELESIREWIAAAHGQFSDVWEAGQLHRWQMEEDECTPQ